MADGKFYELMEAIKAYLPARLPAKAISRVELYEGVFDEKGIKRIVSNEGVIHLAFLGASNIDEGAGGPATIYASYGVYLASSGNDRIRKSMNRLEAVALTLINSGHNGDTGLPVTYVGLPIIGSIENLYSTEAGANAIAIFGMSFAFPIMLGDSIFKSDGDISEDIANWFVEDEDLGTLPLNPVNTEII